MGFFDQPRKHHRERMMADGYSKKEDAVVWEEDEQEGQEADECEAESYDEEEED